MKKKNRFINENTYISLQIIITIILVLSTVILKRNDSTAFYTIKEDYRVFFTTETIHESNFSYSHFINNITDDIQKKYDALVQTISYLYGKGKNDMYPSNVNLKKYTLEEKGTKPVEGILTSEFGIRTDPFNSKTKDFHTGIDIAAAKGTFIKASFDGIVESTGYSDVAGNYIRINSNENLQTFYCHTQFIFVKEGEKVLKNQIIATVGDTGMVTGPHLHFEVILDADRVNPIYAF